MTLKALVLEEDLQLQDLICSHLTDQGFEVVTAQGADAVIEAVRTHDVHVCIIPCRYHGADCYEIARRLRRDTTAGSIILGNTDEEVDIVVALEMGADDYMAKPIRIRELLARIRTIVRRTIGARRTDQSTRALPNGYLRRVNGLEICSVLRSVSVDGQMIELTPMEFDVLSVLAAQTNVVFSRHRIIASIRGGDWSVRDRSIDQIIRRLRSKLFGGDIEQRRIKTVHGRGYMLIETPEGFA